MTLPQIIAEAQRRIDAGDTGDYPSPFGRLADNRPLITCPHCGNLFRQNRPHQKFCNPSCQVGAWNKKMRDRMNAASPGQESTTTAEQVRKEFV